MPARYIGEAQSEQGTGVQIDINYFAQSDLTPFKEIRQILTQHSRSFDDVKTLALRGETVEVSSTYSQWKSHLPTGRRYVYLTFKDDQKISFEWSQDGVHEILPA